MKWSRDIDEWYPSINHNIAVHVMGPAFHTGQCYSVVLENKLHDERVVYADCKSQAEAKRGYKLAREECDRLHGEERVKAHHQLRTSVEQFFKGRHP